MLRDEIGAVLARAGIVVDERELAALTEHAEMQLQANQSLNLTRITSEADVARLHVADSLTVLPWIEAAPVGSLADIGSGGGYPAIPLAIVTGRRSTMIESTAKKATFLASVVETLGLDAEVLSVRAEDAARTHGGRFAVVTARAVAPLASLVELASPLLQAGGRFVALKGAPDAEELNAGDRAAAQVGMRRMEAARVHLPGGDEVRTVVTYEKMSKPRVKLPRRAGMAQHNPLG